MPVFTVYPVKRLFPVCATFPHSFLPMPHLQSDPCLCYFSRVMPICTIKVNTVQHKCKTKFKLITYNPYCHMPSSCSQSPVEAMLTSCCCNGHCVLVVLSYWYTGNYLFTFLISISGRGIGKFSPLLQKSFLSVFIGECHSGQQNIRNYCQSVKDALSHGKNPPCFFRKGKYLPIYEFQEQILYFCCLHDQTCNSVLKLHL